MNYSDYSEEVRPCKICKQSIRFIKIAWTSAEDKWFPVDAKMHVVRKDEEIVELITAIGVVARYPKAGTCGYIPHNRECAQKLKHDPQKD